MFIKAFDTIQNATDLYKQKAVLQWLYNNNSFNIFNV